MIKQETKCKRPEKNTGRGEGGAKRKERGRRQRSIGKQKDTSGKRQKDTRKSLSTEKKYADTSVADPDPGSDAFLIFTPGSGSGIRDPG
jgi:hypothetical protein